MTAAQKRRRDLLLVGGGHAHVQVLRRLAMAPPPDTRVTLVVDTPIAVYSGMVPGFVAGQYQAEELEIDVLPLARRAGARIVVAAAIGIEPEHRRLLVEGRPPLRYDRLSFDIGSTVAGQELPGVRRHAIPTRPIGRFVERLDSILERARRSGGDRFEVVIAGAGAGGVELAFCLESRLRRSGVEPRVTLLDGGERILRGYPAGLVRRVEAEAARRGVRIEVGRRVVGVERDAVSLDGGERLPSALTVWVTGAVSHPLFRDSGLPVDERGFVRVRSTLQVEGHDELFAVGDCATLTEHPRTPKAGVYAVRQGPYVAANLAASLAGRALEPYRPQGDFLTLLNLGDGGALGSKWGVSFGGGRRVVASIDAFRGFTDDPYLVGRIGAVNALSDLWAKGVAPRWAQALVALPEAAPGEADEEVLFQVLAGARSALDAAGVTLVGGHTTTAAELMVGFSVEGLAEEGRPLLELERLRPGRSLVLSKPLGTGVLFHADMQGGLRGEWFLAALAVMERTNAEAAEVAARCGAAAATDVTGFALAGHLGAMARAGGVGATIVLEALPALPGAVELLGLGVRSTLHGENSRLRRGLLIDPGTAGDPRLELLFDPQTSGGLLFDVDPARAAEAVERLREAGDERAAVVGETSAGDPSPGTLTVRARW